MAWRTVSYSYTYKCFLMVKKGTKTDGERKKKGKERKGGLALAPMAAGEFDGSSFHYGGGGRDGKCVRVLRNGGIYV